MNRQSGRLIFNDCRPTWFTQPSIRSEPVRDFTESSAVRSTALGDMANNSYICGVINEMNALKKILHISVSILLPLMISIMGCGITLARCNHSQRTSLATADMHICCNAGGDSHESPHSGCMTFEHLQASPETIVEPTAKITAPSIHVPVAALLAACEPGSHHDVPSAQAAPGLDRDAYSPPPRSILSRICILII